MPKRLLGLLVLASVLAVAKAEVRTWTDQQGRTITAELIWVEDDTFTIRRQGRLYAWPAEKFSEADRVYAETWLVQREAAKKERLEKTVGSFAKHPLTTRAYTDPDDYLAGDVFQDYLLRTRPDYREAMQAGLRYELTNEHAALFVPPNYDESQLFGVYVFVNAGEGARLPDQTYRGLFGKLKLIYIAARGSGNQEVLSRRLGLALDSLATVKAAYRIDPNRCYVGGVSGGGITATMIAYLRPEHFRAAINIARGALLEPYRMKETTPVFGGRSYEAGTTYPPFLPHIDDRHGKLSMAYHDKRWVFISGPEDFNYEFSQASGAQWRKHGYRAKAFDVPGMAHTNAPVDALRTGVPLDRTA